MVISQRLGQVSICFLYFKVSGTASPANARIPWMSYLHRQHPVYAKHNTHSLSCSRECSTCMEHSH